MAPNPTHRKKLSAGNGSPLAGRDARVLVVDDEEFMLDIVGRMLQALGFEVALARGGLEAIESLSRSRYRLVITDLQMPDMNGHALAGWIKHHFQDVAVIIMTGNNPESIRDYVKSGTADRWIFKPFNLNALKTMLGEFV